MFYTNSDCQNVSTLNAFLFQRKAELVYGSDRSLFLWLKLFSYALAKRGPAVIEYSAPKSENAICTHCFSFFWLLIFSGANLRSKHVEAGNEQRSVGICFGRDSKSRSVTVASKMVMIPLYWPSLSCGGSTETISQTSQSFIYWLGISELLETNEAS